MGVLVYVALPPLLGQVLRRLFAGRCSGIGPVGVALDESLRALAAPAGGRHRRHVAAAHCAVSLIVSAEATRSGSGGVPCCVMRRHEGGRSEPAHPSPGKEKPTLPIPSIVRCPPGCDPPVVMVLPMPPTPGCDGACRVPAQAAARRWRDLPAAPRHQSGRDADARVSRARSECRFAASRVGLRLTVSCRFARVPFPYDPIARGARRDQVGAD